MVDGRIQTHNKFNGRIQIHNKSESFGLTNPEQPVNKIGSNHDQDEYKPITFSTGSEFLNTIGYTSSLTFEGEMHMSSKVNFRYLTVTCCRAVKIKELVDGEEITRNKKEFSFTSRKDSGKGSSIKEDSGKGSLFIIPGTSKVPIRDELIESISEVLHSYRSWKEGDERDITVAYDEKNQWGLAIYHPDDHVIHEKMINTIDEWDGKIVKKKILIARKRFFSRRIGREQATKDYAKRNFEKKFEIRN